MSPDDAMYRSTQSIKVSNMIRNGRKQAAINYWLTAFTTRVQCQCQNDRAEWNVVRNAQAAYTRNNVKDNARFHLLQFNLSLPLTLHSVPSMQIDFPDAYWIWKCILPADQTLIIFVCFFGAFQPWRHKIHSQIFNCCPFLAEKRLCVIWSTMGRHSTGDRQHAFRLNSPNYADEYVWMTKCNN